MTSDHPSVPYNHAHSTIARTRYSVIELLDAPSRGSEPVPAPATAAHTRVLVVGADAAVREVVQLRLANPRWTLREAHSGTDALEKLMEESSEVMLLDPRLPDLDTAEFQSIVSLQFPEVQVLTVGLQADDLLCTSFAGHGPGKEVREHLQRAVTHTSTERSVRPVPLHQPFSQPETGFHGMIGGAASMQRVYHAARVVARRDTTVLIQGESGTGKDLLARAIHLASLREKQPFIVINCAAIPETLLEAELFGYTKGAFTGAAQSRMGRVHAAHGGTLFLDEIGDMPHPLQSKILRFLEQGEVQRIGGTETLKVDCRVVAATNADLKKLVKANQFREDLYYRLAVFPIQLPPLREHMEDLDSLTASFLARFCPGVGLDISARRLLLAHNWPGNVRELRNVLERASLFAESRPEICSDDIVL